MTFLTNLEIRGAIWSFRLVQELKAAKEIPESSILGFLEILLANNVALSDAGDNTPGMLNTGGLAC